MITKQPENWIHGMSMELKEKRKMKKLDLNKIYKGNCLDVLKTFPDESVDMCITSPPYWGLRSYGTNPVIWDDDGLCEHEWGDNLLHPTRGDRGDKPDSKHLSAGIKQPTITDSNLCSKCGAWRGELGLEPDFDLFIKHLCDIFDEVKRVLKPHGSCWVNLGDTYYTKSGTDFSDTTLVTNEYLTSTGIQKANKVRDLGLLPSKCLVQIPNRFSIEMTNRGWTLRNEIIWHKPSCMPSSIKDRYTVDFEKLFFFTKNRKYHFKQQFEPMISKPHAPGNKFHEDKVSGPNDRGGKSQWDDTDRVWSSDRGRNKRTVWSVNPASFKGAHFATYPPELIDGPISAGCPLYVCSKCGKAREEKIEQVKHELSENYTGQGKKDYKSAKAENPSDVKRRVLDSMRTENVVVGYTDCGCNEDFVAGVVLDPFIGSGTTAEVAMKQDKNWVGIDLNSDYIDIADKRLKPTIKEKKTRDKASEFWG